MYKKVLQVMIIIGSIVTITFVAIFGSQVPTQDVWLDGTNFVESKESKKYRNDNVLPQHIDKNSNIENSFLASNLDNYGAYIYDGGVNKIGHHNQEELKFAGNIDSYNSIINDAQNVNLWNNDFAVSDLVIKTKNKYSDNDSLNISIINNDKELSIQTGYLRYIVADNDEVAKGLPLVSGITAPLLIPDAITNKQVIKMEKNNIYIYRIRIDRKDTHTHTGDERSKITIQIKNSGKGNTLVDQKQISINKLNYDVNENYDPSGAQDPSYEILNYPTSLVYYYNNKSIDYNNLTYYNAQKQRAREEKGFIPEEAMKSFDDFSDYNMSQYVDWNFKQYWQPEFKYHHDNLKETEFVVNFTHDGNHRKSYKMKNPKDEHSELQGNLWDEDRDGNSWWIPRIKDGRIYLEDSDWLAFDNYVYKMQKLGYKNIVFNGFLKMTFYYSLYYVWNNDSKEWTQQMVQVDLTKDKKLLTGSGNKKLVEYTGYDLRKSFIDSWIKHIIDLESSTKYDNYDYNWARTSKDSDAMNAQFYIDEPNGADVYAITKIFKEVLNKYGYEKYHHYLKTDVAYPIWEMRKDLKWTDEVKDVDILYTNTFHIYNDDFPAIKTLDENRSERNLVTGIYQLSGSSNFDMLKANPAVLMYEMLLLNKQKEPHYMKYMMARWQDSRFQQDSFYYGTYWEKEFFDWPDISGNVSWEYPFVDFAGMKKDDFYSKPIEVNPSVRLEAIAEGINIVRKINILEKRGCLKIDDVNSSINELLSASKIQSKNAFVFDNEKLSFDPKPIKNEVSYIGTLMEQRKSSVGQTDSVKWILHLINKAEEIKRW